MSKKKEKVRRAMKTLREIRPIKQAAEADLLKLAGVTGVDIGYKYVKGKKTDELAIRVYVEKKKAKKDVPKKELIPKTIKGMKTDVIQRKFVLYPFGVRLEDLEIKADQGRYDPLKGGISIGPCRAILLDATEAACHGTSGPGSYVFVGTLGAVVRDNATNNPMLLSNFHVMCVDDGWSVGDAMAQPSRVDGGNCPADVVGQLQRASLGGQVDCAVSSHTARGYACEIADIGEVTGTATASVGMAVRKRGRTTGLTYGEVDTIDLTLSLDYCNGLGVVTLTNQIGIEVDPSKSAKFGDGGDSGSVVVDNARKVVGLFFAGSSDGTYGVANPIQAVLNALNVKICVPKPKEVEKKWEPDKYLWYEGEYVKELVKDFERYKEVVKEGEKFEKPEKRKPEAWKGPPTEPIPPVPRGTIEERLARLEAKVGQLTHFIRPELRPDLRKSPLRREPDLT